MDNNTQAELVARLMENYWREKLASCYDDLPDSGGEQTSHATVDVYSFAVSETVAGKIRSVSNDSDRASFLIYMSFFRLLLGRYFTGSKIVIASPVETLPVNHHEAQNLLFYNIDTDSNGSIIDLLETAKKEMQSVYTNRHYRWNDLAEWMNASHISLPRLLSFCFHDENIHCENPLVKDALLCVRRCRHSYNFNIAYRSDFFSRAFIERFAVHYQNLLAQLSKDTSVRLRDISFMPEAELQQIAEFSTGRKAYPVNATLQGLFEQQADKHPSWVAVSFEEKKLTFRELNTRANQLASYLKSSHQVGHGDIVGVRMEKSEWLPVVLLGILKCGAAYLPVATSDPLNRMLYTIEDSGMRLFLYDELDASLVPGIQEKTRVACLPDVYPNLPHYDSANHEDGEPADLAYVIYTSGSTGKPKGVMVEQDGVVNRIDWMWRYYTFDETDRVLQKTAHTFDVSVWEIFMPLCYGCMLVICPAGVIYDPKTLCALIARSGITTVHFVPSMYNVFLNTIGDKEVRELTSLRHIFNSGEALLNATVNRHYQCFSIPLHNLYGPTEASVDVSYYTAQPNEHVVPIGRPIDNVGLHILDRDLRVVPVGIMGDLYISGVAIARGYLNKPELTRQRFIRAAGQGEIMYKTGDLAKWREDGNILFLGRSDSQVKVRGFRIELSEIENTLLLHEAVEDCAVIVKKQKNDQHFLAAFYSGRRTSEQKLRDFLSASLPEYMIPATFAFLESLPATASGKIDRIQLQHLNARHIVEPANAIEKRIASVWKQVLSYDPVSTTDSFFEVGGHSLNALTLLMNVYREFSIHITLHEFFLNPTVQQLALLVTSGQERSFEPIQPAPRSQLYPLSHAQQRLWLQHQLAQNKYLFNMPGAYLLSGELNFKALKEAFRALIQRHEIFRTTVISDNGRPMQRIHHLTGTDDVVELMVGAAEPVTDQYLSELATAHARHIFDLATGPLYRITLAVIESNRALLMFNMHHIIADGWSMGIIIAEVLNYYDQFIRQGKIEYVPLRIQYKDYVCWHESRMKVEMPALKRYWVTKLGGRIPKTLLPLDYPRASRPSFMGAHLTFSIEAEQVKRLKQFCSDNRITLYAPVVAGLYLLLYGINGQRDLIIGTPVSGRYHPDLEDQIGCYINIIPLLINVDGQQSTAGFVTRINNEVMETFNYHEYPFDVLAEDLRAIQPAMEEIFHCGISWNNFSVGGKEMGFNVDPVASQFNVSKSDLWFYGMEYNDTLRFTVEYNTHLFKRSTIEEMVDHFSHYIGSLAAYPDVTIDELILTVKPHSHNVQAMDEAFGLQI